MYHDPCHTPMKTYDPMKVVNTLMGTPVTLNERCCGESGTLAATRPDISTQVRFRKEEEMKRGAGKLRADLQYSRIDEILSTGLHAFLTQFLDRVNTLGGRISRDFLVPSAA